MDVNNHKKSIGRCTLIQKKSSILSRVIMLLMVTIVAGIIPSAVAQRTTLTGYNIEKLGIKIYFRYDDSSIDSNYMNNSETLKLLDSLLHNNRLISTLDTIAVTAVSSPEGAYGYNARLSERRKVSLEKYLRGKYPSIDSGLWYFNSIAENWTDFRELLASDILLPNREEVLAIVDNDSRTPDDKEWLLKELNYGIPWSYIKEYILPHQRYGASVVFVPRRVKVSVTPEPQTAAKVESPATAATIMERPVVETPQTPEAILAIKSNLVWDLATVVNLGVEVPIGERFSVVGEVVYPWWRSWNANFTMQIESYHAEVKYWLGDRTRREKLTGWSVGLYGGWGRYDIQPFSETGVQGTFWDAGAEIGYAQPIAKNLNLEFTLGVGYVSTTYNDYYMAYDTQEYGDIKVIPYPWTKTRLSTVLPTRFGVSLVWVFDSNKKGGNR